MDWVIASTIRPISRPGKLTPGNPSSGIQNVAIGLRTDPVANRLLIDKNPSLTFLIPPFLRIFPELKLIIALRDPRDVVLSCFRHAMFELATLEGTAGIYAAVMRLAVACRSGLPLTLHELRYERLVEDFEGQVAGVLAH